MKRIEFIKPTLELVPLEDGIVDNYYCKLKITPLERGYGMTLGNSLRRVLLSSLPGAAAVAIQIDGVSHEFCAVDGIREDVTEIILNIKNIIFTINAEKNESGDFGDQDKTYEVRLSTNLPSIEAQLNAGAKDEELVYSKVVTASMIDLTSTVEELPDAVFLETISSFTEASSAETASEITLDCVMLESVPSVSFVEPFAATLTVISSVFSSNSKIGKSSTEVIPKDFKYSIFWVKPL